MQKKTAGFSLPELLVVVAAFLLIAGVGVPNLFKLSSTLRLEQAGFELMTILRSARSLAIRDGLMVGVKFYPEKSRVMFGLYRDGDGDGVRTRDIEAGVDPVLRSLTQIRHLGADIRFGFPDGKPPRDPGNPRRRLSRLDDPIRFNRSDLASFGPLGTSTPGSLYITDGTNLSVVRLYGRTGKMKVLRYDRKLETWSF